MNVQRFGLTVVSEPPGRDALVDLVLVHGLNGNPEKTWTAEHSRIFWPAQLLPQFVEDQKVRVLVYGYDADVTSLAGPGVTKDKIHNHAERLVADLFANRRIRKATERPIVFVAHSLGGLIVKRAMITSSEIMGQKTEHLRSIFVSTFGMLFLGTPHRGADLAQWGSYLETLCHAIMPKKAIDTGPQLVDALKSNSETLLNIDRQFAQLLEDFHIYFFHEAKPSDLKGLLRFIVEEDSAAPTLPDVERAGIQADHQHMCKFESDNAPGFDLVVDAIQRYADEAPVKIRTRWTSEKVMSRQRASGKAMAAFGPDIIAAGSYAYAPDGQSLTSLERLAPVHSDASSIVDTPGSSSLDLVAPRHRNPKSSTDVLVPTRAHTPEPYFIVPPGFRANTFFVGMDKELNLLDQHLFGAPRHDGTASVVLHGQPGSGKTHLARHYIYQNRHKFVGGIFWINAMLKEELYKDFWQIQQKVVAKVAPDFMSTPSDSADDGYVAVVKAWFQSRQDWLMVLDGVGVENESDIQELHRFVPDSKHSSLIYVSRSRRLETMQRLLHPTPIKVAPLKEEHGRALLFKEIGIRNPRESQIRSATELSRKVGGLPLAITAIARRLADTHEPIEKVSLKSYSDDPKIAGTYKLIIDDLYVNNHREALNLIYILCFFGPHIPVEMVNLGAKALTQEQVNINSREDASGEEDINATFSILMRHAMIERNDPDDDESMTSSHDSLVEPEPIDVLNMHAVVQRFCCDSLNAAGCLPTWLTYAVRLFTQSFREANLRISNQPKPPRLSDYRWYLVHGEKLLVHTRHYEHKHQTLANIRQELQPTIDQIHEEIRTREPGSSQESMSRVETQMSIFDRTNSFSSSGHSQHSGNRRPPLAPLVAMDTMPRSRHYASSDDEDCSPPTSHAMLKGLSGSTARPRSDSNASQDWHFIKQGASFRPAPAVTGVDREHATGSILPSKSPNGSYGILTDNYLKSPPATRGRRPIWQRAISRGSSRPRPAPRPQPTYADVLAEQFDGDAANTPRLSSSAPAHGETFPPPRRESRHQLHTRRERPVAYGTKAPPYTATMGREASTCVPSEASYIMKHPSANSSLQSRNVTPLPYEHGVSVQAMPQHMMLGDSLHHTRRSEPIIQAARLSPFAPPGSVDQSPRGRMPDGSPVNKSPKFRGSTPLPPRQFSEVPASDGHSRTTSAPLPGFDRPMKMPPAAYQPRPFHPSATRGGSPASSQRRPSPATTGYNTPAAPSSVAAANAMSRASSGPGFSVPTAHGLGIAPFGHSTPHLAFAQDEASDVEAAPRRVLEWKQRNTMLRERDTNVPWQPPRDRDSEYSKVPYSGTDPGLRRGSAYETQTSLNRAGFEGFSGAGAYTYAPPVHYQQMPPTGRPGNPSPMPWGYASGYGPGSLRPASLNTQMQHIHDSSMQGVDYGSPYAEANTVPREPESLAFQALAEQSQIAHVARARGNSAPETPGWSGNQFWGS